MITKPAPSAPSALAYSADFLAPRARENKPWTADEDRRLKDLGGGGKTNSEIALS